MHKVIAGANDSESFKRAARYLTGTLKVDLATEAWLLRFENGEASEVTRVERDCYCDMWMAASAETWTNMMAESPVPFYQGVQSAKFAHDLDYSWNTMTMQYFPLLDALVRRMRLVCIGGLE
jgi:hypothetical protein